MTDHHGWYGDPAILAAVQLPATGSLGAVICTPLGQEGVIAYRGLRLLADELGKRGVASVRYDPPGRGDAAPSSDPQAPIQGARLAADLLRQAGCTRIVFIGLSSAALIASAAATPDDLVVFWSPPTSGRHWLRRNRSLATIMLGTDRQHEQVESLIGLDLDPQQAAALEAIKLALPGAGPALVATRPNEPVPPSLAGADHFDVPGTAEFLDTSSVTSVKPARAIELITDWVAGHAAEPRTLTAPPLRTELDLGSAIERIRWIGPNRLFAIDCSPADAASDTPVAVLHAGASEHRVGAGDYQVELARLLAGDGVRTIRADRRGAGETGTVRVDEPSMFYTQAWVEDQDAIVAAAAVPGERLALTGLCAGGWMAGQKTVVDPRLVINIHPMDYRVDVAQPNAFVEEVAMPREVTGRLMRWVQRMYRRWAPVWLRRMRARTGSQADTEAFLGGLSKRTWRTVLIFSEVDQEVFRRLGGVETAARMPGIELVNVATIDHPLFGRKARLGVIEKVRCEVAEAFGLPQPVAASDH